MDLVPLLHDLKALAAQHPGAWPLVQQFQEAPPQFSALAPLLTEFSAAAGVGPYRALALLLKADWQSNPCAPQDWQPWEQTPSFRQHLGEAAATLQTAEFEVLLLEQCALSCHVLDQAQVAALAERYERESAVLVQSDEEDRKAFINDKRTWLRDELLLDVLLSLRQDLVAELEQARMQYLAITGQAAVEMVEAAHRLALVRYRLALNDPTLTAEEINLLLAQELGADGTDATLVPLEPELRLALLDTVQAIRADHQSLRRLAEVWSRATVQFASEEEQRHAALLFRRLARLIHPDALQQREGYADILVENRRRLEEIWHHASATHGVRVHLSSERLINYLQNLQAWIDEAGRILRCMSFHAPSRLLEGNTVQDRHADLRRAMLDVQRHQNAVRDDIAHLEFDAQRAEHRRVIAMGERQREEECERMRVRTERWNEEARSLAVELAARVASNARDDAAQASRGAKP